ncbi:MAG TPA: TonB-dependent receptor, partial [Bacteroidetes bacterium]|nr:TonB-dependent receptor [Bacteroidota bacterium]
MRKQLFLFWIMISTVALGFSQNVTISGYVENSETGERFYNATVFDSNNTKYGTASNNYGFYSLTLPRGKVKLTAGYVGFDAYVLEFTVTKDTVINILLTSNTQIGEIVVTAEGNKVENTQMSQINVPVSTINKMPVLFGEVDVLKTVQMLPGVQSGMEGTSGIYVRGGGPDQNLILLDGVPVYNVNHLFGFFSVFNGSAINDISLIKGGFPARYGGRLSSVLDIRMKEGNMKNYSGEVSVGVIASKFTVEGPIIKDKTSFILSGRRTYIDVLAAPFLKIASAIAALDGSNFFFGYFFYDLNAKINHKISEKDRIYLSGYFGKDKAYLRHSSSWYSDYYKTDYELFWGNATAAFRWNHVFSPKVFSNTTITYSNYHFITDIKQEYRFTWFGNAIKEEWGLKYNSGIEDYAAKIDFDFMPNSTHKIKFGISGIHHTFKPGITALKFSSVESAIAIDTSYGNKDLKGYELGTYLEDDFRIGKIFKMNLGVRGTTMLLPDTFFISVEPRVSIRVLLNDKMSVKASYAQMSQYLHFLTNSSVGLPTDLWLPATRLVPPEHSTQYAAGWVMNLSNNYELSIEAFYKKMDGIIEYKEGESFFSDSEIEEDGQIWENKIEIGEGWSYGAEFFIHKKFGKMNGWIGYTLSWSERQFPEIAFGQVFPYRYDRRHDIGILMLYKVNDKIDIGLTWVYGTGIAVTLAEQMYLPINM